MNLNENELYNLKVDIVDGIDELVNSLLNCHSSADSDVIYQIIANEFGNTFSGEQNE